MTSEENFLEEQCSLCNQFLKRTYLSLKIEKIGGYTFIQHLQGQEKGDIQYILERYLSFDQVIKLLSQTYFILKNEMGS